MTKTCLIIGTTILLISFITYSILERVEWLCITCNSEWGMASAEFEQMITLSNDTTLISFSFIPRLSSNRFEVRVFSHEKQEKNNEYQFEKDFIERLRGYHIRIKDENSNIIYERRGDNTLSYTSQEPRFAWLISNIHLKKNKKFSVEIKLLPPDVQRDGQQSIVLVLGIGPRISLFN
jgi:hypothetical protein